jgi:hypothetical protein
MKKLLILAAIAALTTLPVPAEATGINLLTVPTTVVVTGNIGGTATVSTGAQLSGTGRFPAFVQIGQPGGSVVGEQAYNTTANLSTATGGDYNNGSSAVWNHEITKSDLTASGGYYTFFLDINEANNSADQYLSLDQIVISAGSTANLSTETQAPGTIKTIWAMNSLTADLTTNTSTPLVQHILLNYNNFPGSGWADMVLKVPTTAFSGVSSGDFIYLFSAFGYLGTTDVAGTPASAIWGQSDGFEEWAYSSALVPDGGITAFMLGLSMLGLGALRRFRR